MENKNNDFNNLLTKMESNDFLTNIEFLLFLMSSFAEHWQEYKKTKSLHYLWIAHNMTILINSGIKSLNWDDYVSNFEIVEKKEKF